MSMVLAGRPVVCDSDELVYFELPANSTCGTFAEPFLESASGYISNPEESRAGELCGYCQYATGEDVSCPAFCETEDIGLTLTLLAVPSQVRAFAFIDLARLWHFPGFCHCQLCSRLCFCLLAYAQEWEEGSCLESVEHTVYILVEDISVLHFSQPYDHMHQIHLDIVGRLPGWLVGRRHDLRARRYRLLGK